MKLSGFFVKVIFLLLFLLFVFNIIVFFETNRIDLNTSKFESFIGSISPNCAKAGERAESGFDMTKGVIDPNVKKIQCCLGLKSIAGKQKTYNSGVCSHSIGGNYNLCSPCGNGVCDEQYEDRCNCREDCK